MVIAAAALIAWFLARRPSVNTAGCRSGRSSRVGVLVLTGGLSLYVLWPRELSFAFDARATYAELYPLLESVPEAQLRVAYRRSSTSTARARLPCGWGQLPEQTAG
jgi:hypothetical protein